MAESTGNEVRRYRLRGVIGRGGFGTVYLADLIGQSGFTRPVALKVLNPDVKDLPSIAERLRDEARLLGMLRHRSIVAVDGLVRLDGRWTIVMEYIAGASVKVLADAAKIPLGVSVEIAGEIASALHVAYSAPGPSGAPLQLLHRDIKPANVVVGIHGEVKVLDFGVARANFEAREAKTQNMMFGSIGYMAPERYDLREEHVSDVYAVGVILWELITGDLYGRASSKPSRYAEHMATQMARLAEEPNVPAALTALITEILAYEPDERPSARDVERRCRDLRLAAPAPWLRDWAEDLVPTFLIDVDALEEHDFSTDILSEAHSVGLPAHTPEPDAEPEPLAQVPRRSLPTFTADYLAEEADPNPAPTPPPAPVAPPAKESTWANEIDALVADRKRPEPPPKAASPKKKTGAMVRRKSTAPTRTRRKKTYTPNAGMVFLQAFGGLSLLTLIIGGGAFVVFFIMCVCMCAGSN